MIDGMATGRLRVGSRAPVADTPAWVTLEVAHGGFATGRDLAEGELLEHEAALLASLPAELRGESPRERLNAWSLGDAGQAQLQAAVDACRYRTPRVRIRAAARAGACSAGPSGLTGCSAEGRRPAS